MRDRRRYENIAEQQQNDEQSKYGCSDPKAGAAETLYSLLSDPRLNHRCEVRAGVLEDQCRELLRSFFRARRAAPSDGGRGIRWVSPRPAPPQ